MKQDDKIGRNAPCPCGSGQKYKNCCLKKAAIETVQKSARTTWLILGAAAVGLVTLVTAIVLLRDEPVSPQPVASPPVTPTPWYHDVANNRHWHPDHGHWHDGPPPTTPAGRLAPDASTGSGTPAAWEYDAANNRHWDPDHGHWHDGPPPVGASTRSTP